MRKINAKKFRRATRGTPREINRRIVLNLIREHQPVSRAELARLMGVSRGMVSRPVLELLESGSIYEGVFASTPRGRPPKMLHVRTRDRLVVAIDVRFNRTHLLLTDFAGTRIATDRIATATDPAELIEALAARVLEMLRAHGGSGECEGIGLVVPGMIDRRRGRILNSPALGWRDVDIRDELSSRVGLRVLIENASIASALAQMWLKPPGESVNDFAYVTVSDGLGVGIVVNGEVLRGATDTAGEFGHLPLDVDGPRCRCGLRGCLEAYASNLATLGRYLRLDPAEPSDRDAMRRSGLTLADLIARARAGDLRARACLDETARALGIGIAGIVASLNPGCVFLDGEIVNGWDLMGAEVLASMRARALTEATRATPLVPVYEGRVARLRGAAALLVARTFAAPRVA